jgi:ABC-type Na+ efflux pump permease subunit
MNKTLLIAGREFISTVATKAFIIGLLLMPTLVALGMVLGPRLFNLRNFKVEGELAIIDPTRAIAPELRKALDPAAIAERRAAEAKQAIARAPEAVQQLADSRAAEAALGPIPQLQLVERPPDGDAQREKEWLIDAHQGPRRLALIVIHPDAVVPAPGTSEYGNYDLYVPAGLDDRAIDEIQRNVREVLVTARVRNRGLDRQVLDALVRVPRIRSVTVTKEAERQTVRELNLLLPMSCGLLLFLGVMTGGQALLTSTVEEKSSRVIEVLLSAVSPMQLMAGKLLGQMAVSFVALALYLGMGMVMLVSFSLFGLFNPWLIFYLLIFFTIMYLVIGSLMMAVGAAVNEMREAQSLMMPIMMFLIIPWILWMPISRDPNSTFSIAISFVPPINTFAMLLRMASSTPPPWWQVWISIAIGIGSVFAALWFAAKVFRIGLLMYGKPPNLATLVRWARTA